MQKLFQTVTEMLEDEDGFVVIMIGEYEYTLNFWVDVCKGEYSGDGRGGRGYGRWEGDVYGER